MSPEVMSAAIAALGIVAGMILSWLLQEFSSWFKARKAEKRELGMVVTELYRIHTESITLRAMLVKQSPRTVEQNKADLIASRAFDRSFYYLHQPERLSAALEEARKHVAARNPVAATHLDVVREIVEQLNKACTAEISHDEWLKQFVHTLAGFQDRDDELKQLVLRVALMHSPLTWWRVKCAWKESHTKLQTGVTLPPTPSCAPLREGNGKAGEG